MTVIAFTNTKGGVGKSTLACNSAIWLYDQGQSVALIDADGQATATVWLQAAEPRLTVVTATDMEAIQVARDELIKTHDFVIIDVPGEEGEAANTATLLSDIAILPLQPTKPDVRALKDALKTIRLAHSVTKGMKPFAILVLNGVRKRSVRKSLLRQQLSQYGYCVAKTEVRRFDAIAESCDSAVTRDKTPQSIEAAADIEDLCRELFSNLFRTKEVANG